MDRNRLTTGKRLTANGLYHIIRRIGGAVGVETHPHGIRHLSITRALVATGGNIQKVQQFSRHKDVRTVLVYNDQTADHQGEVATLVAGYATTQISRRRAARRRE